MNKEVYLPNRVHVNKNKSNVYNILLEYDKNGCNYMSRVVNL